MAEQEAENDWLVRRLAIGLPRSEADIVVPEVPNSFSYSMILWTVDAYIQQLKVERPDISTANPDRVLNLIEGWTLKVLVRPELSDKLTDEDILAYANRWQERRRTDRWQRERRSDWIVHARAEDSDIAIVLEDTRGLIPYLCCGYLSVRNLWDICEICFWENDFDTYPNVESFANHITLVEGQANFLRMGASKARSRDFVRTPDHLDERDPSWRPVDLSRDVDESGEIKRAPNNRNYPYYWRYIR